MFSVYCSNLLICKFCSLKLSTISFSFKSCIEWYKTFNNGSYKSCRSMFRLKIMLFSLKMVYGFYRKVPFNRKSPSAGHSKKWPFWPFRNHSTEFGYFKSSVFQTELSTVFLERAINGPFHAAPFFSVLKGSRFSVKSPHKNTKLQKIL